MDLLEFIMGVAPFTTGLDILELQKVVFYMKFLIIIWKSKCDSYYSLPLEKITTFYNVIILSKSSYKLSKE